MFNTVSRTLVIALALSTAAGCAVSADDAPPTTDDAPVKAESSAETKSVSDAPIDPEAALADMAQSLLKSLMGEGVSALFPHDGIDYDRLAASFKQAAQQADLDQTLMEQARDVDGRAVSLAEDEVRFNSGSADIPGLIQLLNADQDNISPMLTTLSDPKLEQAGLAAYISGAQIKLSILGFLMKIDPTHAESYRQQLAYDANTYFDHVSKVEQALIAQGKQSRMSQFTDCRAYYDTTFGFLIGYEFTDNGTSPKPTLYEFTDGTCNTTRDLLLYGAGANKIISMGTDFQWITTILNAWQVIGRPNTVSVVTAAYGNSCNATPNNVTNVVGLSCNGQSDCTYTVSRDVLGDQRVGCAKDFEVHYTCAGSSTAIKTVILPPEANGHSVELTCP